MGIRDLVPQGNRDEMPQVWGRGPWGLSGQGDLAMKEAHQIKEQIAQAYKDLESYPISQYGTGGWRRTRGYIDALEWVLGLG